MEKEKKYGKLCWHIDNKEKYIEFERREEAQTWGMALYKNWSEKYKQIMRMSCDTVKCSLCTAPLECYCGYSYRQVNEFLRFGLHSENYTYRELSDILSIVLCSAPRIPHDLIVYRMVNDKFIDMLVEKNKQKSPAPIQERGFMSTSLLKDIANADAPYARENNLLKIFVPKDTIGVYADAVTSRNEEEMLLSPNMFLGIVSYPYEEKKLGKTIYECKLIKFY